MTAHWYYKIIQPNRKEPKIMVCAQRQNLAHLIVELKKWLIANRILSLLTV